MKPLPPSPTAMDTRRCTRHPAAEAHWRPATHIPVSALHRPTVTKQAPGGTRADPPRSGSRPPWLCRAEETPPPDTSHLGSADETGRSLRGIKKVFQNCNFAKRQRVAHTFNHGWWQLAGGGWRLVGIGGRRSAVGGGWWQLAVVGGWRLVVGEGWWLASPRYTAFKMQI